MFANLIAEKKLHEGSVLAYLSNGKILQSGIATRKGIQCLCTSCDGHNIFGVSAFEDHAGSGHRRPTKHIFVHDDKEGGYGRSLDMLKSGPKSRNLDQIQSVDHGGDTLKATKQKSRIPTLEENYIICNLCSLRERRGELPFCSRERIADGRLCCLNRICRECRSPLYETTAYSIAFQKTLKNGEKWNPLLNCDQCGDTYHSGCLTYKRRLDLHERNGHIGSFLSFCSVDCEKISMTVEELVQCSIPYQKDIPPLTVIKWNHELFLSFLVRTEPSIDTLHSLGKLRALSAQKLLYALDLLSKTFSDENSSRRTNLFKNMIYNHRSTQSDLDYNGFLVVLIEEDKEVTINKNKPKKMIREVFAAATIRIHSQKVVEMPFIATSESSLGLPLCRRFVLGLDEMLKQLGLLIWVVQSPPELEGMWEKLSFHRVSQEFMTSLLNKSNLLQLEDTTFMCKDIRRTI